MDVLRGGLVRNAASDGVGRRALRIPRGRCTVTVGARQTWRTGFVAIGDVGGGVEDERTGLKKAIVTSGDFLFVVAGGGGGRWC
jgi:hypothetical protein